MQLAYCGACQTSQAYRSNGQATRMRTIQHQRGPWQPVVDAIVLVRKLT